MSKINGGKCDDEIKRDDGGDSFNCGQGNDKIDDFADEGDTKTDDCEGF